MYRDEDADILSEVVSHFRLWEEDNNIRLTRKGGWNDVTDAYWGKLPADWPYINKVIDPRVRTTINEKDNRILNAKLRGRLVPREGGDVIKAKINNAILDFQWDNANDGGSMLSKLKQMSQDTRLYASKFGLVKWKYECDKNGKVVFNGNEMKPLDIRDCGIDPTADHIRNAKWFQHREWAKLDDLEKILDTVPDDQGKDKFRIKIEKLRGMMSNSSDRRDIRYGNRLLQLKSLTDRTGEDKAFPIVEIVTEYRKDRWITFSPRYNIILRDIENPYQHGKIPVIQLRYYSIQGDPLGESEVEPVLGLWRTIQAILCGFLDSFNTHIKPPLKILDGQVRIETIIFGPEAQMIMNRPDAVTEFTSSGEAIRYFQTAYQSAVSAFNNAMGEISQGISAVDPFEQKKTATEIKQSSKQQNVTDQANQNCLADMLTDMMSMWLVNNRQFLFQDESMKEYVMRIVGRENFEYFQRAGMADTEISPEAMQAVGDVIMEHGGNMSDDDINQLMQSGALPKFPVISNPTEKNPDKLDIKPKLEVNEMNDAANLYAVPEDLDGNYDYIADVESMAAGASADLMNGRQQALEALKDPTVLQLLSQEGKRPKMSDLLISIFDGLNLEGERYFEDAQPQAALPSSASPMPQQAQNMQQPPMPTEMDQLNSIIDQGTQAISSQPQPMYGQPTTGATY